MKSKLLLVLPMIVLPLIAGCSPCEECDCDDGAPVTEGTVSQDETVPTRLEGEGVSQQFTIDNAFYYTQITGGGEEIHTLAYVLFEYEKEETVNYQVAYVACTCRGPSVNYHSVAYVELSKKDGSVVFMSYDRDSGGHYSPGLYGDSTETGDGTPVKALFKKFREEKLVGSTQDKIFKIEPMHGEVDAYTGATVTPNNSVEMLKGLFGYHNKRYM